MSNIYASDDPRVRAERGRLLFVEPEEHVAKRTKKTANVYGTMELLPVMIYEKGISVEQIKRKDGVGIGETVIRGFLPRASNLVKGEKDLYEVTYRFVPYSKIAKVMRVRTLTVNVYTFITTEGRFAVDASIPGIKPYIEWIKNNLELRKLQEMRREIDGM